MRKQFWIAILALFLATRGMDAGSYGRLIAWITWSVFAGMSIWLAAGGMPSTVEVTFIYVLWGFVVLLSTFTLIQVLPPFCRPLKEMKVKGGGKRDPKFFRVFNLLRLVFFVSLFIAGKPVIAGCFVLLFVTYPAAIAFNRRRGPPAGLPANHQQ